MSKRFTDAELCAEFESARCDWIMADATGDYWSPLGDGWSHDQQSVTDRVMTLLRFASAPNYEESDA